MKKYNLELWLNSSSFEGNMKITVSVNKSDGKSFDDLAQQSFLEFKEKNPQFEELTLYLWVMAFDEYMGWK